MRDRRPPRNKAGKPSRTKENPMERKKQHSAKETDGMRGIHEKVEHITVPLSLFRLLYFLINLIITLFCTSETGKA